jgi:hypothetical protein
MTDSQVRMRGGAPSLRQKRRSRTVAEEAAGACPGGKRKRLQGRERELDQTGERQDPAYDRPARRAYRGATATGLLPRQGLPPGQARRPDSEQRDTNDELGDRHRYRSYPAASAWRHKQQRRLQAKAAVS